MTEASKKYAPTAHINSPIGTGIPRFYHPRMKNPPIGNIKGNIKGVGSNTVRHGVRCDRI